MEIPPAQAGKVEWRAWATHARLGVDLPTISGRAVARLASWRVVKSARAVLLFLPLKDEIDLRGLLDAGLSCSFLATRTPEHGRRLTVHELGGSLEPHPYGFLQPRESSPRIDPGELDLVFLPGMAFDLWGNRLGRGAGYFDRLLMEVPPEATLAGVIPAALVVDELPHDSHDVPVDYLATEEGVVPVAV